MGDAYRLGAIEGPDRIDQQRYAVPLAVEEPDDEISLTIMSHDEAGEALVKVKRLGGLLSSALKLNCTFRQGRRGGRGHRQVGKGQVEVELDYW